jgi:hypothetical protein
MTEVGVVGIVQGINAKIFGSLGITMDARVVAEWPLHISVPTCWLEAHLTNLAGVNTSPEVENDEANNVWRREFPVNCT